MNKLCNWRRNDKLKCREKNCEFFVFDIVYKFWINKENNFIFIVLIWDEI